MIRADTKSINSRDLNYLAPLHLLILAKQKQHYVESTIDWASGHSYPNIALTHLISWHSLYQILKTINDQF